MIVAGHHHLPAHGLDGIERVQEFLLRRFFTAQEMNVVDHQQIEFTHLSSENVDLARPQRGEEFVRELFARQVRPAPRWMMRYELLAKTLQKMGFAQAACAMDEK